MRLFAVAVAAKMRDGSTKAFQFVNQATSEEVAETMALRDLNTHSLRVDGGGEGISYEVLHYSAMEIPAHFMVAHLSRAGS